MFMQFMKTNFAGPINVNNAFLPHMRARRLGTLVLFGGFAVYKSEFMVRFSCSSLGGKKYANIWF